MDRAKSACSTAVVLAAALCYLTPSPPPASDQPGPRGAVEGPCPEAPVALYKEKAEQSRADKEEEEATRQLQQQLSWGRDRCTTGAPGRGHADNCRCRQGARPALFGPDGLTDGDARGSRRDPARSVRLPRDRRRVAP
jgi:hypothetical protein